MTCERVAYNKESWYCLTHNQLEGREEEKEQVSINICEICGCEYLWGHACGESCLCEICGECDKVKRECECQEETV